MMVAEAWTEEEEVSDVSAAAAAATTTTFGQSIGFFHWIRRRR